MHKRWLFAGGPLAASALFLFSGAAPVPAEATPDILQDRPIQGVTVPSKESKPAFGQVGVMTQLLVKEGDQVQIGQNLAQQDDSEEQLQLELDKEAADDAVTELNVERSILVQDNSTLQDYRNSGAASVEINEQIQKVTVDKARVDLAVGKEGEARTKVKLTAAHLKKLSLTSKISGVVAQKFLDEGDVSDPQNPVLHIIQIDPIWVEAQVPTAKARKLKIGDPAYVTLTDDNDHHLPGGKVLLVPPMANSANETIMVRIEIPNPEKLQPGDNVTVKFTGDAGEASAAAPGP